MARNLHNLAGRGCAWMVGLYRRFVSPLKPSCCRFTPTCSAYSREAFLVYGFWKGMGLTIWRILRCHPFYHGNLNDPVPPPKTKPGADGE